MLPAATFFQAIPYFFLALVLVLIFGETGSLLKWFPSLYGYDIYGVNPGMNLPYIGSIIGHAVLPCTDRDPRIDGRIHPLDAQPDDHHHG